jgi:RNA recognition motif-containing protein
MFLANGDNCSKENVPAETGNSSGDSSDEDEPPEPDTTLFIKNLNFNTNQEDIKEVSIEFVMLLLGVLR